MMEGCVILGIRNACKALIVHDNKILLNKNQNSIDDMCYGLQNGAIYYDFPGGGQNQYETLEEAVVRECIEESGYTVSVEKLVAVYEEISINEKLRKAYEEYAHKVHFVFVCKLTDTPLKPLAEGEDLDMLQSEWIELENVKNMPLYPLTLRDKLPQLLTTDIPMYLGAERIE